MNNYNWKILDITNNGDSIISARYFVSATNDKNKVETEGNHVFKDQSISVPFNKLYEQIIVNKIIDETLIDGISTIQSRLDEQLTYLNIEQSSGLPWLANTFTPNI